MIAGRLTRDPERKVMPNGNPVSKFTLAVNRVYTANGEKKEHVSFIPIVVFGKQADSCPQYLKKGSGALVEGGINIKEYEDKQGNKRKHFEVVADRVQFGAKPKPDNQSAPTATAQEETNDSPDWEMEF